MSSEDALQYFDVVEKKKKKRFKAGHKPVQWSGCVMGVL